MINKATLNEHQMISNTFKTGWAAKTSRWTNQPEGQLEERSERVEKPERAYVPDHQRAQGGER